MLQVLHLNAYSISVIVQLNDLDREQNIINHSAPICTGIKSKHEFELINIILGLSNTISFKLIERSLRDQLHEYFQNM